MANAGISQSLPDDAGVVSLLVVSLNSRENFLGRFRLRVGRGIDRSAPAAAKSVPAGDRARWPECRGKCFRQEHGSFKSL